LKENMHAYEGMSVPNMQEVAQNVINEECDVVKMMNLIES